MAKYKFSRCDFTHTEENKLNDDKFKFHEIKGYKVTNLPIDWIELVIHRNIDFPKSRSWLVSEATTGYRIGFPAFSPRDDIIDFVLESLKNRGKEFVQLKIAEKLAEINEFKAQQKEKTDAHSKV